MSTQASCNCIKIVYKLIGDPEEYSISVNRDYALYNGRFVYTFLLFPISSTVIYQLRYSVKAKWEFMRININNAELYSQNNCPFGNYTIVPYGLSTFEYFRVEECTSEPEDPEVQCFKLLVWKKQCEYSKCVLNYLKQLQFGNVDCELLDLLKNKRRVLKILNCYDTRDIVSDTTNYNTLTYSEIKKLLEY